MFLAIFGIVTPNRTNEQQGDPSAGLLFTSEKAVFCNCYVHGGGRGYAHGDVHCCDDGVGHVGLDESSSS